MYFFAGLVAVYTALWLLSLAGIDMLATDHVRGTYAAGIMFILAGIMHFVRPRTFIRMMPNTIWNKEFTNWLVGIGITILGAALFFKDYRQNAAYALIAFLIIVFPANLKVANNNSTSYNVSRAIFQPVYIAWIYWFCVYHTW